MIFKGHSIFKEFSTIFKEFSTCFLGKLIYFIAIFMFFFTEMFSRLKIVNFFLNHEMKLRFSRMAQSKFKKIFSYKSIISILIYKISNETLFKEN